MSAIRDIFSDTLFTIGWTPKPNLLAMLIFGVANTAMRFVAVYLSIRVVATALAHGSF